ncbi:MAG: phage portal protein [Crenarchaeota archaeon]|nr:phage portal protein [Thermoproteota archaeon]
MKSFGEILKHSWNAFRARDETPIETYPQNSIGLFSMTNPSRSKAYKLSDRSIITTITNRIAIDVASFDIQHVKVDQNGRYLETINDPLNMCLTVEANKDQTGRNLIMDIAMSMFDEGYVAVVPIETTFDPYVTGAYDIYSLRTGKILEWFPDYVKVEVYNDQSGQRETLVVPKNITCIIENPLFSIMNEPNSTLKQLIQKLNMLDSIDKQVSSGKLDLIIQLPYSLSTERKQEQANQRLRSIESQLTTGRYGVAYIDGTERITQLNRPVENNLFTQVQYLTSSLYNQLGLTEEIFNGKASEQALRNYYDRTIEPIVTAIIEEMRRKFLTKTARTQGHSIMGFRDVFRLIPANEIANIADVFSRNEILTANEIRQIVGRKPSDAPHADELRNKNMPIPNNRNIANTSINTGGTNDEQKEI